MRCSMSYLAAGPAMPGRHRRPFITAAMDRYTAKTPSGRDVSGRLEVEDGIRYIVQTGDDDDETWYMVHTSTVRKEEDNG